MPSRGEYGLKKLNTMVQSGAYFLCFSRIYHGRFHSLKGQESIRKWNAVPDHLIGRDFAFLELIASKIELLCSFAF